MAPLTHLEVVTAPLVNHAMAHNGIRVVRQITLVSSPDLDGGHTDVVLLLFGPTTTTTTAIRITASNNNNITTTSSSISRCRCGSIRH